MPRRDAVCVRTGPGVRPSVIPESWLPWQVPHHPAITMHWLYLAIAIIAEVTATSFLRASAGFTKLLPSVVVVIGYGVAFFFLSLTLEDIPVGIGYAIWSGVGVTLLAAIGWLVLGQKLDAPAIIGMALIVAGVVVMNLFSKTVTH